MLALGPQSPGIWVASQPSFLLQWFQAFFWNSSTASPSFFSQFWPHLFISPERSQDAEDAFELGMHTTFVSERLPPAPWQTLLGDHHLL